MTSNSSTKLNAQLVIQAAIQAAKTRGGLVQTIPFSDIPTVSPLQQPFLGVDTAPSTLPPQIQISSVFTSASVTQPPLTSISGTVTTQKPIAPPMGGVQPVSLLDKYE